MADLEETDLDDKETEQRVVRKQDIRLLPWTCITYLLNYLNRVSLGNARTLNDDTPADNILQQLNLSGHRYNVAVAFFFVPYVVMEFPGNMLMKYCSPSKWISRIVITVGLVTICTAAATTYERLLIARFFLGICESGFSSGVMLHLCFWYKPEERATRMAILASSVALACGLGGLLASGISFLNGARNFAGWQWLFFLEGSPTVLVGLAVWFFLPDYPQTATWLTPYERAIAVKRLGPHSPKMEPGGWEWKVVKNTVADPIFWLFAFQYTLMTHALNAYGYFAPTIISQMGFSGPSGQLLTVPPNILALVVVVGTCLHSDKTRERSRHIVAALAFVATGYLILATVEHWKLRYAAVCVVACTNAAVLPFIAHRTATVKGSTATAVATGGMVAMSNTAGISAPFLFPHSTAPMFSMGNWTIFSALLVSIGMSLCAWYVFGSSSGYREDLEALEKTGGTVDFLYAENEPTTSASSTTLEVNAVKQVDQREVAVEVKQ